MGDTPSPCGHNFIGFGPRFGAFLAESQFFFFSPRHADRPWTSHLAGAQYGHLCFVCPPDALTTRCLRRVSCLTCFSLLWFHDCVFFADSRFSWTARCCWLHILAHELSVFETSVTLPSSGMLMVREACFSVQDMCTSRLGGACCMRAKSRP